MNYEISIKLGNLLLEKDATFIVNTSNTTMILGSGVSMAFKRHCGLELQDAMNTQLKHRGNINQGDVVKTLSYATNFKYSKSLFNKMSSFFKRRCDKFNIKVFFPY